MNNYFNSGLLHQFHTIFNKDHKVYDTNPTIADTNPDKFFVVEYETTKIGTNIVPEEIYKEVNSMPEKPILCDENGEYYDRKTKGCIPFFDISNIKKDIEIDKIDVAYSHNYGMAFWILLEDHKNIKKPLNFDWQYHMKISMQFEENLDNPDNSTFKTYCFPQNYFPYTAIIGNPDLPLKEKTEQVLNSVTKEYIGEEKDVGGKWTWIQCSLSYNNRLFYLNDIQGELHSETIYKYGDNYTKNDEPLGYFYNNIGEKLSKLNIEITSNNDNSSHKKIYLRCFYLFKDYLPFNYNFKFCRI